MREIKFRAWDKVNKKFREDFSILIDREGSILDNKKDDYVNDDYVIQQFTGLKDKNGREIFEGDICRYKFDAQPYQQLIVQSREFIFVITDIREIYRIENNRFIVSNWNNVEVIGNVYESPELLEGKEQR